jgi:hypothetical protein
MSYAVELLGEDDDGTMPQNVADLASTVVGRRIVSAERKTLPVKRWSFSEDVDTMEQFVLTLDDGTQVGLADADDCCAYTELKSFLLHPERVDHIITGVGTTGGFTRWHIYADMGDVLELTVGWSCGNPFYYAYGFDIYVVPLGSATGGLVTES